MAMVREELQKDFDAGGKREYECLEDNVGCSRFYVKTGVVVKMLKFMVKKRWYAREWVLYLL